MGADCPTFKHDTEGALSNLLADSEMSSDDAIGGCRLRMVGRRRGNNMGGGHGWGDSRCYGARVDESIGVMRWEAGRDSIAEREWLRQMFGSASPAPSLRFGLNYHSSHPPPGHTAKLDYMLCILCNRYTVHTAACKCTASG